MRRWSLAIPLAALALVLAAGPAKAQVGPPQVDVTVLEAPRWTDEGVVARVFLETRDGPGSFQVQVGVPAAFAAPGGHAPLPPRLALAGARSGPLPPGPWPTPADFAPGPAELPRPRAEPVFGQVLWGPATEVNLEDGRTVRVIFAPDGSSELGAPPKTAATTGADAELPATLVVALAAPFPLPLGPEAVPPLFLRVLSPVSDQHLVVQVLAPGPAPIVPEAPEANSTPSIPAWALVACAALGGGVLAVLGWINCRDRGIPGLGLLLFTRLRRPELLDQPTRRRIHEAIEAESGIQYASLRERLGLPAGVLTHHLAVLESHGLVTSLRNGAQRRLYAGSPVSASAPATPADRILRLVESRPLAQRDIAAAVEASRQSVAYHLQALLAAGRIQRERDRDGRWLYAPARSLR